MKEKELATSAHRRFYRDGAPYVDNFEAVASLLVDKQKHQDLFITMTLDLVRTIHEHLADCQDALGKAESLVEEARAERYPQEKIDRMISLCRDLQNLQTRLVDNVVENMNQVIHAVFPE